MYTLDDPYIHMSMAKNLVRYNMWGLNGNEFSSSSSSPLWTLILSGFYAIFGITTIGPFLLNMILSSLLLFLLYRIVRSFSMSCAAAFGVLGAVVIFTPLPVLVFCGQEHIAHGIVSVMFLYSAMHAEDQQANSPPRFLFLIILFVLSILLVGLRYEGIFLIVLAGCFFLVRQKKIIAGSILLGGMLPVVVYGIISCLHGWYFLPNPILLKGNLPSLSLHGLIDFFYVFVRNLYRTPHLLFMLIGVLGLIIAQPGEKGRTSHKIQLLLCLITGMIMLHVLFAKVGWFYRYEAYLIIVGILGISISAYNGQMEWFQRFLKAGSRIARVSSICLGFLVLVPFLGRSVISITKIPAACRNIYQQQFQMSLFIQQNYPGECVGANDIGLINFLAEIHCIDLWGLSNKYVAKQILNNEYNTETIASLVFDSGCKAVVVYDSWFMHYGGIPSHWVQVEQWHIQGNVVCGDSVVTWYAPEARDAPELKNHLETFHPHLMHAGGIVSE